MDLNRCGMFIDGEEVQGTGGERIDVVNPADETVIGSVPRGRTADVDRAITSAEKAFKEWKRVPASRRGNLLMDLADALHRDRERIGRLLCLEHGKPYREALEELEGTLGYLRMAAMSARRIEGDILPSDSPGEQVWIQKVPYGVTVGLVAWNFPVALAGRKLGPALAAGNTMVVKPPTDAPMAVVEFAKLAVEVGIPPGVFNVVTGTGSEVGRDLVRHPKTRLVTHTGSTGAGQQIIADSAEWVTDLILELGGNAPFIVMDDADVERAVDAALTARFYNCGQVCTCNERMYLHEAVYDDFMSRYLPRVQALTLGHQLSNPDIGPKVNRVELERVENLVKAAVAAGARVETGGRRPEGNEFNKGYWYEPTVLTGVSSDMAVVREEIFGPVLPVMAFKSFEGALEMANDCEFGLSAYLWTSDMKRIMRTVDELDFGEIYLNRGIGELPQSYHTGMKKSGLAGEDGRYGLENYLHKKAYYVNYS